MKIKKDENQIIGNSTIDGPDDQSNRITWLVNNYLIQIASDGVSWTVLYQDPEDKRYWELTFPRSEIHGGGAPSLILISENDAKGKI